MNFLLIGVNHNSAPVEVRERFAIAEPQLAEAVSRLCHYPGSEEGMILSTCNRVELLARSENGSAGLHAFMGNYFRTAPENFAPYFYEFREQQAVRSIYLVGAGKMSELAARHLLAQGAGKIFVSNRTPERALALAQKFGGEAIPFEQLYESADRADVVITSTGREQPIFRREHGEIFLSRRKNRPMFFIDIAVPRDVDGEMNKLDGIFVYDIDDLQSVVSE